MLKINRSDLLVICSVVLLIMAMSCSVNKSNVSKAHDAPKDTPLKLEVASIDNYMDTLRASPEKLGFIKFEPTQADLDSARKNEAHKNSRKKYSGNALYTKLHNSGHDVYLKKKGDNMILYGRVRNQSQPAKPDSAAILPCTEP